MKNILSIIKAWLPVFFTVVTALHANAQSAANCTMLGSQIQTDLETVSGSPLTAINTGLDFNLNLTLPGQLNCNGNYNVTVNTSANLEQGTTAPTYPYPFVASGTANPNQYINGTLLSSTGAGIGINIPFKFIPGTTCNGETGTFKVTINLVCLDGTKHECILNVTLKAIAKNYWVVTKQRVFGNLSGGGIYWNVIISNTNPNPGIGDLNICNGSIKDVLSPGDEIISVSGGGLSGLIGLNTSTATWNTGTIASNTSGAVYQVVTYSCQSAGTLIKNCADFNFCLGKEVPLIHYNSSNSNNTATPDNAATQDRQKIKSNNLKQTSADRSLPQYQTACCQDTSGTTCASVTLVGTPTVSANFGKLRTYGNNLNYAQGCQGEYQIVVSNNGNIPINNLIITDPFPAGINVTQIAVTASGTTMGYNVTVAPPATTSTGFNTSASNYSQTWSSGFPSNFTLTTTSGSLLGGEIVITIDFTITGAQGTVIKNCASVNYSGTYNGWANWCGVALPPIPNASQLQSCDTFTVQAPRSIPGITKCIPGGQQTFSVGDVIPFRIVVSNHGQGNFSGNLADFLGTPQNLQLVAGSVSYSYGPGPFSPYSTVPGCMPDLGNSSPTPPSWVSGTPTSTNLSWTINSMPGDCDLYTASYLIIDFSAMVLPQSFGDYNNPATLSTSSGTLTGTAYYNIMRVAKISTTKQANTAFAEQGQPFNYNIDVINAGSVGLNHIQVVDQLPGCVTYTGPMTAEKLSASGSSTVSVTGTPPNINFPGLVLQPGESVQLTIPVSRNSDSLTTPCCNLEAKAIGTTTDAAAQTISDENGPACVESTLCCNIPGLNVVFNTTNINGGIVPAFLISTSSPDPIQEIDISLMDYQAVYNNASCQPLNMGNLTGHIQPFVGYNGSNYYNFNSVPYLGSPALTLQTVINPVNNSLTWAGPNPINISSSWNGLVALNFIAPDIVNLDCCSGTVYFCFKVRVKDVNCNVCEKIVCGSAVIPKAPQLPWVNDQAKDQFKLKSLGGTPGKPGNGVNLRDLFKSNKSN